MYIKLLINKCMCVKYMYMKLLKVLAFLCFHFHAHQPKVELRVHNVTALHQNSGSKEARCLTVLTKRSVVVNPVLPPYILFY